jgi:hypothetical protein
MRAYLRIHPDIVVTLRAGATRGRPHTRIAAEVPLTENEWPISRASNS